MKEIISFLVALAIGFAGGYYLSGKDKVDDGAMEHKDDHTHSAHEHMEVAGVVPEVDLVLHEDPKGGYSAQVLLTNFRFAPEKVSTAHVPGEGHAHIYVDGVKINRVYGEWYNLGNLESGSEVEVRLSSNDHKELTSGGGVISDKEIVKAGDSMMMEDDKMEGDSMMHDDDMHMEQ